MAENVEHPSDAESDGELEQYDVVDLVERDGVIVIDSEGSDWDSQDDGAVSDPDETDSERDTDDSSSSDSELERSLNLDELDLERDGIIVLDLEDSDSEQEQEQDHVFVGAQLEENNSESEEDVYPSSFSVWQRICARVLQLRNRNGRRIDWNRSRPYSERRRFR